MPNIKQAGPARRTLWLVIALLLIAVSARSFMVGDMVTGVSSLIAGLLFGGAAVVQLIRGRRRD